MAQITWRNINDPDFSSAAAMTRDASNSFSQGVASITTAMDKVGQNIDNRQQSDFDKHYGAFMMDLGNMSVEEQQAMKESGALSSAALQERFGSHGDKYNPMQADKDIHAAESQAMTDFFNKSKYADEKTREEDRPHMQGVMDALSQGDIAGARKLASSVTNITNQTKLFEMINNRSDTEFSQGMQKQEFGLKQAQFGETVKNNALSRENMELDLATKKATLARQDAARKALDAWVGVGESESTKDGNGTVRNAQVAKQQADVAALVEGNVRDGRPATEGLDANQLKLYKATEAQYEESLKPKDPSKFDPTTLMLNQSKEAQIAYESGKGTKAMAIEARNKVADGVANLPKIKQDFIDKVTTASAGLFNNKEEREAYIKSMVAKQFAEFELTPERKATYDALAAETEDRYKEVTATAEQAARKRNGLDSPMGEAVIAQSTFNGAAPIGTQAQLKEIATSFADTSTALGNTEDAKKNFVSLYMQTYTDANAAYKDVTGKNLSPKAYANILENIPRTGSNNLIGTKAGGINTDGIIAATTKLAVTFQDDDMREKALNDVEAFRQDMTDSGIEIEAKKRRDNAQIYANLLIGEKGRANIDDRRSPKSYSSESIGKRVLGMDLEGVKVPLSSAADLDLSSMGKADSNGTIRTGAKEMFTRPGTLYNQR